MPQVACEDEDEDVATEHLRVSSGAASSDILQVNQLTKVYQHLNKKVHAVKRLSVGIPAGEVSLQDIMHKGSVSASEWYNEIGQLFPWWEYRSLIGIKSTK